MNRLGLKFYNPFRENGTQALPVPRKKRIRLKEERTSLIRTHIRKKENL